MASNAFAPPSGCLTVYGVDSLLTVHDVDKYGLSWTELDRWKQARGGFSRVRMGKKREGAEGGTILVLSIDVCRRSFYAQNWSGLFFPYH